MTVAGKMSAATVAALLLAGVQGAAVGQERAATRSAEALYSISGQVVDAGDGQYVLRSDGGGRTKVRLPGWPSDLKMRGPSIGIGDEVTVIGRLDQDLLDGGALDVLGIYVEDRRAYFTLGETVDGAPGTLTPLIMPSGGFTATESPASLIGVITSIGEGSLVFRAGAADVVVDTADLSYDPFDDVGSAPLSVGDLVMVEGVLARDAAGGTRFRAQNVTSIFVVGAAA